MYGAWAPHCKEFAWTLSEMRSNRTVWGKGLNSLTSILRVVQATVLRIDCPQGKDGHRETVDRLSQ